jgi:hypothetical protein
MSPGGLLSVGTGDSTGIGGTVWDGFGLWLGGAGEVGADELGGLAVEVDPFAHPTRSSSPAMARAVVRRVVCMAGLLRSTFPTDVRHRP